MDVRRRRSFLAVIPMALVVGIGISRAYTTPAPTGGAIVAPIGRSATIAAAPARADAENTFIVAGIHATALRILSQSLDMAMGITSYVASPLGDGKWRVANVEVPMVGRWGIEVQARRNRSWVTVGEIAYYVPFTGPMQLVRAKQTKRP